VIIIPKGSDGSFKLENSDQSSQDMVRSLNENLSCDLIGPFLNAVADPASCTILDHVITIRNPFGSNSFTAEGDVI
jgi:hypothetical protein